ncbi:MAG: hypothetical protein OEN50_06570 [Deltaproteobacteria bacterium]|nr:hypothetical protein [Deltaproteobacteria bacterium]
MMVRTSFRIKIILVASALLFPSLSFAQSLSFKEIDARVSEYRTWLDLVGSKGSRLWMRLDSKKRPHRLYVGEGFRLANYQEKENFIDIFSRFLAGHPEKNMLIDIFDDSTGTLIGEYGFGGFRLF